MYVETRDCLIHGSCKCRFPATTFDTSVRVLPFNINKSGLTSINQVPVRSRLCAFSGQNSTRTHNGLVAHVISPPPHLIWGKHSYVDNEAGSRRNMPSGLPSLHKLSWNEDWKPSAPKPGEQIPNTRRREGLHRLPEILYSLCFFLSLHFCPSFILLMALFASSFLVFIYLFIYVFLPADEKKVKREFAHLSE